MIKVYFVSNGKGKFIAVFHSYDLFQACEAILEQQASTENCIVHSFVDWSNSFEDSIEVEAESLGIDVGTFSEVELEALAHAFSTLNNTRKSNFNS